MRVLCNVVPGERWTETTLHELGHAAYDVAIDRGLPWTLRTPSHIFTTEAIAMLHGRQTRRAAFLTRFAGLSEQLATNPLHAHALRRGLLVFVPWVQVMTRFEQALYADPDADLGATWWQLVERYQRVAPPGGERPDDWASKLHIALAPVYYQNYLLGRGHGLAAGGRDRARDGRRQPGRGSAAGRRVPARPLHAARREPALGCADRGGDGRAAQPRALRRGADRRLRAQASTLTGLPAQ